MVADEVTKLMALLNLQQSELAVCPDEGYFLLQSLSCPHPLLLELRAKYLTVKAMGRDRVLFFIQEICMYLY
jgi:hypothetical protein